MVHLKTDECMHFITEVLALLKSTNQYEQVFSLVVDRVVRMYHCQACAIIIIDPATEYLKVEASEGLSLTFEKEFRRKFATGAIGKLLWTGKPILISNAAKQSQLAEEVKLENQFGSCLCVQISVDQRTLGYLHAETKAADGFTEDDIPILQAFADFVGIALVKSHLYEEILRLDRIDHDTGLEKYAPFLDKLSTELTRAQDEHEKFAVVLMDIDNFKQIALTYGYEVSKQMLKECADVIRSFLRPIDAAGRYGYDEFVVLRVKTSQDDALKFADAIRRAIEEKEFTSKKFHATVSVGVAMFPRHAQTEQELLLCAKEALYGAQRSGRNIVVWYEAEA
ncbi:MAG TPA: sensor domain-containing diguanylate cyclase [Bacteroidota bacterium]|jgi:diguanylate cyclase (GGDEF)-like protein|nr:sensor domain-containing diguanylate cyclase [Bacteroidota bacterium]